MRVHEGHEGGSHMLVHEGHDGDLTCFCMRGMMSPNNMALHR